MSFRPDRLSSPSSATAVRAGWSCAGLLVAAVFLAWSNAFSAPFVLDDHDAILDNPTIRTLWPPHWLAPPATGGQTVSGRPVLNLSFALDHALHGLDPRGYHATNVALHACAALLVFGILRRTLGLLRARAGPAAERGELALACGIALLWALHPLQTAAVTYLAQRAESLAGLFYLLAVYGFLRAVEGAAGGRASLRAGWAVASVAACLLGVGTKETLVTAPLVILLLDRAFLAGSLGAAWRARGRLHAALFATWIPLAALVLADRGRGGSAGFDSAIEPGIYLLTQCEALVRYLALVCWPAGQVFDYGVPTASGFGAVWPQALALTALAAGAVWGLVRNRPAGFLGAVFFLLLAPSSSVVPVATQTMAEHRMYLALLVPVVLAGGGATWIARRANVSWLAGAAMAAVALALGATTFARNRVYRTELALWQDTADKRPENTRARHNLGLAFVAANRAEEAMAEFRAAIALRPEHAFARHSLGVLLLEREQAEEAAAQFAAALAAQPDYAEARLGLGEAFVQLGRLEEAEAQLRGVRLSGDEPAALRATLTATFVALGNRRAGEKDYARAMTAYEAVLALDPSATRARANLANCLLVTGRPGEAIAHYEAVLRSRPDDAAVRRNLEIAREMAGRRQ